MCPGHYDFFSWWYTWVDVICILNVVILSVGKISLLSSWNDMDVRVELLADDVWSVEDYKTIFLSVGVDSLDQSYLKEQPISLPIVKISTIKRKDEKWG